MIAVVLDLAVMGKEFITTHLELTTSTGELTLPVNCPDQFSCTIRLCIGLNRLFGTKKLRNMQVMSGSVLIMGILANTSVIRNGKETAALCSLGV